MRDGGLTNAATDQLVLVAQPFTHYLPARIQHKLLKLLVFSLH